MDKENVVYTYRGVLYSLKKKGNMPYAIALMNLEDIMLSEITELQRDKYCIIPLI